MNAEGVKKMEENKSNTKKVFFSGVLLLSFSTLLVKIIGLLYKIPMLSYLGSEGMGYFHSAYELYALFCIIATAGLPVALSVLISEALAKGREAAVTRIYRVATGIFLGIGALGTIVMWAGADLFCYWIRSESARACVVAIAPTLFFVCFSSAVRGYFQGFQRMLPTAVSQLIEAIGKLVFGLLFAHLALYRGADTAHVAAAAGWGLTLGSALSTLYLFIEKARFHPFEKGKPITEVPLHHSGVWRRLMALAVPMTLGASLVSLTKLVDMAMILRRLQAIGYTESMANEAYGSYTTLALSVYGLLPTLLNSVFLPLVPMLTSAIASKDREKQTQMVETSYRLTAFFAMPASLGLSAFSEPILRLLFSNEPEAVAVAAPLLSMLGASVFLSCMISASNSVLHAYQVVNRPILALLVGAAVKVVVAYWLIGLESVGLMGAPISTLLCNATVVLMNLFFAAPLCGKLSARRIFLRPLWLSLVAVGVPFGMYLFFADRFGASSALAVSCMLSAVVLYLLLAIVGGAVSKDDLAALPMGKQLCRVLCRLKLLQK